MSRLTVAYPQEQLSDLDVVSRELVRDLHRPRPLIYWSDALGHAVIGWGAFALAVGFRTSWIAWSSLTVVSVLALYRCLCFTHEITHLRRDAVRGFETAWNLIAGLPLLLPTFAYVGVHQLHHQLSTYGTADDPEYLPFATSRRLIWVFAIEAAILFPIALVVRFLLVAPAGLLVPRLHRWLEVHASSFAMNPAFRRQMSSAAVARMRRWELLILAVWGAAIAVAASGRVTWMIFLQWVIVTIGISFLNTLRVLGAHEYDSDGHMLSRHGQLADSIDVPGGPWTALWAPVGLRYHALHHYFPGIPYHNLGAAYRRLLASAACREPYGEQSSSGLCHSLTALYMRANKGQPGELTVGTANTRV
jgi:fatty acid desaturase